MNVYSERYPFAPVQRVPNAVRSADFDQRHERVGIAAATRLSSTVNVVSIEVKIWLNPYATLRRMQHTAAYFAPAAPIAAANTPEPVSERNGAKHFVRKLDGKGSGCLEAVLYRTISVDWRRNVPIGG